MSGGVDSSVAAYLMQQRGFRCEGTTMRLYRNADIGLSQFHTCCSQRDIDDAAEVAFQLDIPYEVLDFTMDFKSRVIEKFPAPAPPRLWSPTAASTPLQATRWA